MTTSIYAVPGFYKNVTPVKDTFCLRFYTLPTMNSYKRISFLIFYTLAGGLSLFAQSKDEDSEMMTQAELERIIWQEAEQPQGEGGIVQFIYNDVNMALISDENFDRMRIIAPVINVEDMTQGQINSILSANFQTALDARYAANEGVLYSAYIHPLFSLNRDEVSSALGQVAALVKNFGTTYSSDASLYLQQDQQ